MDSTRRISLALTFEEGGKNFKFLHISPKDDYYKDAS